MKENKVTVVFTSCGRFGFLNETIKSFIKFNDYPIEKFIVIDNGMLPNTYNIIEDMFENTDNVEIIVNEENIGQVGSIDKAYSLINTEYIFHCEDDWEFLDSGFVGLSVDVLNNNLNVGNVIVRVRFDGEKGSMHPITGHFTTPNNTIYHEYVQNVFNTWHGFSWNPGLRRLSDYNKMKPYKRYGNEQGMNKKMKEMGFKAVCLEKQYCKHIGTNSITLKSNQ